MYKDEALKLALEALETCEVAWPGTRFKSKYFAEDEVKAAITAIKQVRALDKKAENARELGLDYEPVPENFMDALRFDVAMRDAAPVQSCYCPNCEAMGKELTALKAQPAVQEPLSDLQKDAANLLFALHDAWPYVHGNCTIESKRKAIQALIVKHGDFADLHPPATQRQWIGLTDEEILEAAGIDGADTWLFETAYAIEAKLREKNQ
jgi:hypothetical protein